ncbi:BatA domain-containing protein [Stieleria sp. JC731]|uniref:BatA domain-containing protein n=1 Tax=Pirellulaceae TaxID=2691357 RepID=UPI001E49FF51|nr:BatA domain-containing protein [Stieleria sp. JC731]MCC9601727.1 BatA domain-containing protein [Stieleria sp. JC731]
MFLYPALLAGFAFIAVPPLVHLINMLRHRRQRWAAMDFLLASYRKQKKWLRLRQLLLLLARIAIAAVLVAMLCGWTGGRQLLGVLGGRTTHHIVILDDSYSMGDISGSGERTTYDRALEALAQLTQRLATSDGNHQLTVMRASRAALAVQAGNESGDTAADVSAQTIQNDSALITRVVATNASAVRTDLVPAIDLAAQLAGGMDSDEQFVYIASDFRSRDWAATDRLAESLQAFDTDTQIRMIDCAFAPERNLGVTRLVPVQDVWVAGVPVVVRATIKNFSDSAVKNVTLACRMIRYGNEVTTVDPSRQVSGISESLPGLVIDSIPAGGEITKSFQVFINETGTHAIEVELPIDALPTDNKRVCTLPLSDAERVLIIDGDPTESGAYTVAAVLDPGSQVRIGAVPDIKPPAFLRSASKEMLMPYRAIYLIDLPDLTEAAGVALDEYVRAGGGLAWFLGENVQPKQYNQTLLSQGRQLLPRQLDRISDLDVGGDQKTGDMLFGDEDTLLDPLRGAGDSSLSLIGIQKSWSILDDVSADDEVTAPRFRTVLKRRDNQPIVTEHYVGAGTVVTVMTEPDAKWTNWPGDPTFVPFMLLTNAKLWSGAAATTSRVVTDAMTRTFSTREYFPEVKLALPSQSPPRTVIELKAESSSDAGEVASLSIKPTEMLISGTLGIDEFLRPGLFEWGVMSTEGVSSVIPLATTIAGGEGDLQRADAAEIRQALLPIEIQFISSDDWRNQNQYAGNSSFGLAMLGLLAILLICEQFLAYLASYHAKGGDGSAKTSGALASGKLGSSVSSFGLGATGTGGRAS